ncbi:MAG: hypothetical protein PHV34_05875 [Verrucomicrobiae bacterium]|nr:hypothetical protein [Verrucomicrobiae bacterium]
MSEPTLSEVYAKVCALETLLREREKNSDRHQEWLEKHDQEIRELRESRAGFWGWIAGAGAVGGLVSWALSFFKHG